MCSASSTAISTASSRPIWRSGRGRRRNEFAVSRWPFADRNVHAGSACADWCRSLLSDVDPALRKQAEVEVVSDGQRPTANGQRIYHLGNNPHHEWIYNEAMQHPGVIVLHDIVLHHLIVEMTLARGDANGYIAALQANHGEAGAAWARGRAAGLHSEMGNFLLPASVDVANRSRAVIVHNRYAADRLQSFGVTTPIHVVPHPFEPQPSARGRRDAVRAQHGFASNDRVIGLFGFLTSAKRADVVLAAFAEAKARDPKL